MRVCVAKQLLCLGHTVMHAVNKVSQRKGRGGASTLRVAAEEGQGVGYFEGCSRAEDPESPLGPGDGDIEAPHVCQEADARLQAGLAGTHT